MALMGELFDVGTFLPCRHVCGSGSDSPSNMKRIVALQSKAFRKESPAKAELGLAPRSLVVRLGSRH